jgi:DNA polymerase-3 subunit beta
MKFSCEKNLLEAQLAPLSRVVSTKSTLPILENILVEASPEGVKLAATDLEIGMKGKLPAKVMESGSVTIPAKIFFDVVSHLKPGVVEVFLNPEIGMAELKGEGFQYKFNVLPSDDYPALPDIPSEEKITLPQGTLKSVLKDTLFAASPLREDNPVLTGILFKLDGDLLTLVALDGYRLAKRSVKIPKSPFSRTMIIPARALAELSKILKDEEEPLELYLGAHQVMFKFGETLFFSRLLEGQFPQFERVIPEKSEFVVKVEKDALLQALRRASIVALDRESPRLVKISLSGNKLVITANTQDVGQAYEEIKVEGGRKAEKAETVVAFNAKYLIDALSVLDHPKVKLELGQSTNPGVIKPETGDEFLYVVMPVRTVGELVKV